ncbi:unnamed protein product [Onchocerca flexuosa]|uniref:Zf-RVT domain-containing protein n=1 Tax=Onchocerca flexuosa TaxID=387005 RepID=A0A183HYU3_9BILA|nr:unnamed protein product [Onchocerca flexuosa]
MLPQQFQCNAPKISNPAPDPVPLKGKAQQIIAQFLMPSDPLIHAFRRKSTSLITSLSNRSGQNRWNVLYWIEVRFDSWAYHLQTWEKFVVHVLSNHFPRAITREVAGVTAQCQLFLGWGLFGYKGGVSVSRGVSKVWSTSLERAHI